MSWRGHNTATGAVFPSSFRGGRAGVTKVAGPNKAQFQLNLSSFTHFNGNFHYEFQVPSCSQKMALKDLRLGVSKRP